MSVHQTQADSVLLDQTATPRIRMRSRRLILSKQAMRVLALTLVMLLAGGGGITAQQTRLRAYNMAVSGHVFDLMAWEVQAISEKARANILQPARGMSAEDASAQVTAYILRAQRIGEIEREIDRLLSQGGSRTDGATVELKTELDMLRSQQDVVRTQVEQIIERQVGYGLAQEGFTFLGLPFPPVQFTFTEPPKKLIVSPRDRIVTKHSKMLDPATPLAVIEQAEAEINAADRSRAYITNIGGLGAFPTMVVDRASLEWVLSTVAHEWVHNYLTMYPLGWNYFKSQDMTTLNETVADIVGDEVGAYVARSFYPSLDTEAENELGEVLAEDEAEELGSVDPPFDFRAEMRATRLEVDRLLADGRIEEAETYMELQRLKFVENGHPLRVLNQAYFAFHGSYGTSAASTSPIGPKLRELRELTPDLETFVNTVKKFNSLDDLDRALDEWTVRTGEASP